MTATALNWGRWCSVSRCVWPSVGEEGTSPHELPFSVEN